eukprot:5607783-Prymnesium_polylepis.1
MIGHEREPRKAVSGLAARCDCEKVASIWREAKWCSVEVCSTLRVMLRASERERRAHTSESGAVGGGRQRRWAGLRAAAPPRGGREREASDLRAAAPPDRILDPRPSVEGVMHRRARRVEAARAEQVGLGLEVVVVEDEAGWDEERGEQLRGEGGGSGGGYGLRIRVEDTG